jgi:hypothetical protein
LLLGEDRRWIMRTDKEKEDRKGEEKTKDGTG